MRTILVQLFAVALAASAVQCAPARPATSTTTTTAANVEPGAPEAVPPERVLAPVVERTILLSRATTWALALDASYVYFGDAATSTFGAVPKLGGKTERIGRGAPWAVALTPRAVVWIAAPGDAVLERPPPPYVASAARSEPAEVLRTGGVFSALAADASDVYVAESAGDENRVVRIHEGRSNTVASIDRRARALAIDDRHVYVLTDDAIHRISRAGGRRDVVAKGYHLARLVVDDGWVYTTAEMGPTRALARAPKTGGDLAIVEPGVRDAPIAAYGDEMFYFDIAQPELRRVAKAGGASAMVLQTPALARIDAMAIDASGIFVGTEGEGGGVMAVPLAPAQ